MPSALITGITGQDGSYLAELLLGKGYRVAGITRDVTRATQGYLAPLAGRLDLRQASLEDVDVLRRIVLEVTPDEIYNLAGETKVSASWSDPAGTGEVNALGAARVLEAARMGAPRARVFQASSCEMFDPSDVPLREESPLRPSSPYGVAKMYAHFMSAAFRESFAMHVVSGILFNHESPRRGESFVTRKISRAVSRIVRREQRELRLGNLASRRDWGFAGDYVDAMWRMLQRDPPEDLVIGTGEAHSVRDFCERAFSVAGLDYRDYVVSDPELTRPADARLRVADASRARTRLGWTPRVSFDALVEMMVESDMKDSAE